MYTMLIIFLTAGFVWLSFENQLGMVQSKPVGWGITVNGSQFLPHYTKKPNAIIEMDFFNWQLKKYLRCHNGIYKFCKESHITQSKNHSYRILETYYIWFTCYDREQKGKRTQFDPYHQEIKYNYFFTFCMLFQKNNVWKEITALCPYLWEISMFYESNNLILQNSTKNNCDYQYLYS
jgi:hypothetical protein